MKTMKHGLMIAGGLSAVMLLGACSSGSGYYSDGYSSMSVSAYDSPSPGYRDRDRDGVPNRYDRDRDGDGVPNRFDDRPSNPYRD